MPSSPPKTPVSSVDPRPAPTPRPRSRTEYEHLEPLFAERRLLPAGHLRRKVLRERLITGYRPVALHIARKHAYRGSDLDDLEQVATMGLIQAVDRFDPERGIGFLSFAVPTMTGELLRHFRDRVRIVRVPRRLDEMRPALHRATGELTQRLGRAPRPSELAAHLGVDRELVVDALQALHAGHSSLDEPTGDGRGGDQSRFDSALALTDPDLALVEDRESLLPLLAALPERSRQILMLRFFRGMTQTEIAGRIGVSQMQISRVLAATLAQLRRQAAGPPAETARDGAAARRSRG